MSKKPKQTQQTELVTSADFQNLRKKLETDIMEEPNIETAADKHSTMTALERIKQYQDSIAKEIDTLKTELARTLSRAAEQVGILKELGHTNWSQDPQYFEFKAVLGIGTGVDTPNAPKTPTGAGRAARSGKPTAKAYIVSLLEKMGADMHKQAILSNGQESGYGIPALNAAIQSLTKAETIKVVERGVYRLGKSK